MKKLLLFLLLPSLAMAHCRHPVCRMIRHANPSQHWVAWLILAISLLVLGVYMARWIKGKHTAWLYWGQTIAASIATCCLYQLFLW